MIETLLFSVLIIAIAVALLLIKVVLKKNGRFSSQHIHDSEAMKERGIHCVIDQDRETRGLNWKDWCSVLKRILPTPTSRSTACLTMPLRPFASSASVTSTFVPASASMSAPLPRLAASSSSAPIGTTTSVRSASATKSSEPHFQSPTSLVSNL